MEDEYKEVWNEVCFLIDKHKNGPEREFQILIEGIFEKLGWSQYKGEMARPTILFGAANRGIPDLVIQNENGEKYFVVELKKVGAGITDRNVEQLLSYMRQLKLEFGLIIGNSIQVYYDKLYDNKEPEKVCDIKLENNNELGVSLIKQLSKAIFKKEKFDNFCKEQIRKKTILKENEKRIEYLCSYDGMSYLKELLSTEYAKEVLDEIEIVVKRKKPVMNFAVTEKTVSHGNPKKEFPPGWNLEMIKNKGGVRDCCIKNGVKIGNYFTLTSRNAKHPHNYWSNARFELLNSDWCLIFNDPEKSLLHICKIPAKAIDPNELVPRNDKKHEIDLQIDTTKFEDVRGKAKYGRGVCFDKWIIKTISYLN